MRDFTLADIFQRNSQISPNDTALVKDSTTYSFLELQTLLVNLSIQLQKNGISKGDRVAFLALNHPAFFSLYGAIAQIGAILVPLNWRLSVDELRYILKDCSPKLVFTDKHQQDKAYEIVESMDCSVLQLDDTLEITDNQPLITQDLPKVKGSDPVCIIYTAAVDGYPRGAVLSHTNLLSANLQVIGLMGLSSNDCNLAMLPLFHITGMNIALAVMQLGGKNVILEKFDEEETLALTERENVTLWGSFPPILQRMTEQIQKSSTIPKSLQYVVGIDGPENIAAFEELSSARFWILYGQSETSGFVTFSAASDKPGTAGKQGLLSNYMIVDEADNAVDIGTIGEIVVRGPLVFQGYWNLAEVNEFTFRNGWHHTGDLGMIDDEGYLVYKGRKPEKELIKPGGENVYPAEVEAVILQHPDIISVCVIGVPDPKFGEGVKAVCVLQNDSSLTEKGLIEFVGSRIARYKKPGYVDFIDEMPMKDGQIDRLQIKELYG